MLLQGQVGSGLNLSANAGQGQQLNLRQAGQGDLIVSELMPRYAAAAIGRQKFYGSLSAGVTTTASLTASAVVAPFLYNPVGSGVNVIVTKVGVAFTVAFAGAAAIGIATGFNATLLSTTTAAGNPGASSFVGVGAAPQGKVYAGATTTSASLVHTYLGAGDTGAITTVPLAWTPPTDLEGGIVLPPGAWAYIYTSAVSGASATFGSYEWIELPNP